MSNGNKKIKASDIVVKKDSEAAQENNKAKKRAKIYKLLLFVGVLCIIAYVALLIAFWTQGRGVGRMFTGKMIMLASGIVGGIGAAAITGCTIINETKKMFSIGVALLGVFAVSLFVTYMLLLTDYTNGTNVAGVGSAFAVLTVGSLVVGIILMIVAAIRTKVEKVLAAKKARR